MKATSIFTGLDAGGIIGCMADKNEMVVRPLNVLQLKDSDTVWGGMRRRPPGEMKRVDVVVLHPDLHEVLRGKRENRVLVGLHAALAETHYICAIATLTDAQIEGVTDAGYTMEQVEKWLFDGYEILPCLPGGDQAFALTQLNMAVQDKVVRIITPVQS